MRETKISQKAHMPSYRLAVSKLKREFLTQYWIFSRVDVGIAIS